MSENKYTYAIMHSDEQVELTCDSPPEQFMQVVTSVLTLLGFRLEEVPLNVYVQRADNGVWEAIHGEEETSGAFLFPLPPSSKSKEPTLGDEEYYQIGRKALAVYGQLRDRVSRLKASKLAGDRAVQAAIRDLQEKMRAIERAVQGTDMENLFSWRYARNAKIDFCAVKLHLSARSVNRRVHEMAVYIGRVLHSTLKPRQLQDLMGMANDKSQIKPAARRRRLRTVPQWNQTNPRQIDVVPPSS
ncbi:MAG: hypothetical protein K6T81_16320 [Alicyclobacillus macrosporangiidus]|uniref:hypothetical protein n=1 Tax=Alicyclobacillus macrosporangiidus TaxID=392015 RepID=UPI0026F19575|nr:hypothetical protein [Alicyclobacillus macrosporangiidus]MCL6600281.1 hypothetical protein [Alicyclobacillus macrosporangiidus]